MTSSKTNQAQNQQSVNTKNTSLNADKPSLEEVKSSLEEVKSSLTNFYKTFDQETKEASQVEAVTNSLDNDTLSSNDPIKLSNAILRISDAIETASLPQNMKDSFWDKTAKQRETITDFVLGFKVLPQTTNKESEKHIEKQVQDVQGRKEHSSKLYPFHYEQKLRALFNLQQKLVVEGDERSQAFSDKGIIHTCYHADQLIQKAKKVINQYAMLSDSRKEFIQNFKVIKEKLDQKIERAENLPTRKNAPNKDWKEALEILQLNDETTKSTSTEAMQIALKKIAACQFIESINSILQNAALVSMKAIRGRVHNAILTQLKDTNSSVFKLKKFGTSQMSGCNIPELKKAQESITELLAPDVNATKIKVGIEPSPVSAPAKVPSTEASPEPSPVSVPASAPAKVQSTEPAAEPEKTPEPAKEEAKVESPVTSLVPAAELAPDAAQVEKRKRQW